MAGAIDGAERAGGDRPGLWLEPLGVLEYAEAHALMRRRVAERAEGRGVDRLLLVEHPEVITLGRRRGARANVVAAGGVPVVEVERGGDVTWHGPGQLVGYPVVLLRDGERDVHRVLRALEGALIAVLAGCGLAATRREGHTGVWASPVDGGEGRAGALYKVGSLGLAVDRWVTLHGFALNVDCDLSRFAMINPCGLESRVMGSMRSLGASIPSREELAERLHREVARELSREAIGE